MSARLSVEAVDGSTLALEGKQYLKSPKRVSVYNQSSPTLKLGSATAVAER